METELQDRTDQEISILKKKIQVVESYARDLQTMYRAYTGQTYHINGPLSAMDRLEAVDMIVADLVDLG